MQKDDLLKLGISNEDADKIMELFTAATKDLVPKEKLAEVEAEKVRLATSLAKRDQQLEELQTSATDIETVKTQLATAISKNETDSRTAAAELATLRKNNALDLALIKAGAKNPTAVKALLDLDKISLDGENLIGFNEQLEPIKTSDDYLFNEGSDLSGRTPSAGSGGKHADDTKENPFKKETWNLTKQAEIYKKDPVQAKRLATAAGESPSWLV